MCAACSKQYSSWYHDLKSAFLPTPSYRTLKHTSSYHRLLRWITLCSKTPQRRPLSSVTNRPASSATVVHCVNHNQALISSLSAPAFIYKDIHHPLIAIKPVVAFTIAISMHVNACINDIVTGTCESKSRIEVNLVPSIRAILSSSLIRHTLTMPCAAAAASCSIMCVHPHTDPARDLDKWPW